VGNTELGMTNVLWQRHMGHVLLVFLSSSLDGASFGAVVEARHARMQSDEVRKESRSLRGHTETEGVITVYQQPVCIRCLQAYRASLLGRRGGGRGNWVCGRR
jgi:hypothetical protein